MKKKDKDLARVVDSQYGAPLATASKNQPVPNDETAPQVKLYCDCGQSEYWCTRGCTMPSVGETPEIP